jgi:hypothetical protein
MRIQASPARVVHAVWIRWSWYKVSESGSGSERVTLDGILSRAGRHGGHKGSDNITY